MGNKKITTDNAVTPQMVDLTEILSQGVETNDTTPSFSLEPEEEHTEYATLDPDPEPDPEPSVEYDQPAAGDFMPPRALAETIVNLLDGLQSSVIPLLRERKVFTAQELTDMQNLDRDAAYELLNSDQRKLLTKLKRHEAFIKKIPFDKGEKSRLVDATARYAETTQMQVSPFTGLLMAYSEVIIKRGAYFMTE